MFSTWLRSVKWEQREHPKKQLKTGQSGALKAKTSNFGAPGPPKMSPKSAYDGFHKAAYAKKAEVLDSIAGHSREPPVATPKPPQNRSKIDAKRLLY